jgi:hypothetical protein
MMKKEEREAKRAFWLQHIRECSACGERLSRYAQRHGLDVDEGYRWKRRLRRAGLWPLKPRSDCGATALVARQSAPRFARVRVASAQEAEFSSALTLRLMLANGRRAELTLSDEQQLPRVLKLLEEPP